MFERSAGILLHPTSLPGRFGIGELGRETLNFVDLLEATGQTLWQFMPLGPTGYGDSPYYSLSAFAGNPLLISLETLAEEGWLSGAELEAAPPFPTGVVDFGPVIDFKKQILHTAYNRFKEQATRQDKKALDAFKSANKSWLDDFVMFMAFKDYHEGAVWNTWDKALAYRKPKALKEWSKKLEDEIGYYIFLQFKFDQQWQKVRQYANAKGVKLIGDIPIFVAFDSADVWANPDIFYLDKELNPTHIAGVPPDYFSATGQRWGNPLYNWDKLAETGYHWWVERFRQALKQVDIVRIDHFRGFYNYWAIPSEEETAINGEWRMGPGTAVFDAVEAALGQCPVLAEDLGDLVPEVYELRDKLGFPGMKIMQFAFGTDGLNLFLPHNHTKSSVVYTGSHDNDTARGWYEKTSPEEQHRVRLFTNSDGSEINWALIRLAFSSVADIAIIPLQDILGLGSEGRMNFPGRPYGNWAWRFTFEEIRVEWLEYYKFLTGLYARDAESQVKLKKLAETGVLDKQY
jgi:4-alpha-glucanotransferase